MRRRKFLRGSAAPEWALAAVLILLGVIAAVRWSGTSVQAELDEAATNVADPTTLATRYSQP